MPIQDHPIESAVKRWWQEPRGIIARTVVNRASPYSLSSSHQAADPRTANKFHTNSRCGSLTLTRLWGIHHCGETLMAVPDLPQDLTKVLSVPTAPHTAVSRRTSLMAAQNSTRTRSLLRIVPCLVLRRARCRSWMVRGFVDHQSERWGGYREACASRRRAQRKKVWGLLCPIPPLTIGFFFGLIQRLVCKWPIRRRPRR